MNQPPSVSMRCPYCNLTNFATADYCKRCKNALPSPAGTQAQPRTDAQTININISIPQGQQTPAQPNVNINGAPAHRPGLPPQQYSPQPQYVPQQYPQQPQAPYQQQYQTRPQLPPNPAYNPPAPRTPGEYQLQNQTGFNQWQQMNAQTAPQPPAPVYRPATPVYMQVPVQTVLRQGKDLIVHTSAELPPYCVKCNQDASIYSGGAVVTQKYRWHHPALYAAIISPLIYVILAAALSRRASVDLPLCSTHFENRKNTGGFLIGAGVISMIIIFLLGAGGSPGLAILLFFGALFGIPLAHEYFYKPLRTKKIDNDFVYLTGADKGFLDRLPYC